MKPRDQNHTYAKLDRAVDKAQSFERKVIAFAKRMRSMRRSAMSETDRAEAIEIALELKPDLIKAGNWEEVVRDYAKSGMDLGE